MTLKRLFWAVLLRRAALAAPLIAAALASCATSVAAVDSPLPLATTAQELTRRLTAPVSVSWSGTPLRETVLARGRLSGVAVVVDRRVDPNAAVESAVANEPLESVFQTLARRHGLGVSLFGTVVYLGPVEAANDLRTIAALRQQESQSWPVDLRGLVTRKAPLSWNELTEPRAIFEQLTAEARLRTTNLEALPHDLWPAVALPPLSLLDRWTLITTQFGLTFRIEPAARTLTLVPQEKPATMARRYTVQAASLEATLERWQKLAPTAEFRREADGLTVVGRVEDHGRIMTGASPAARPPQAAVAGPAAAGQQRYTLRLKNKPFSELVRLLRDTHKLPIEIDDEAIRQAGISLETPTNVEVSEATLEELLQKAGRPLGLAVQAAGGKLRIVPRP